MEGTSVRCPKCAHEQRGGKECKACGVIFARYERYLERQKEQQQAIKSTPGGGGKLPTIIGIILLMALTAGGTYYYVKPQPDPAATASLNSQPEKIEISTPVEQKRQQSSQTEPVLQEPLAVPSKSSSIEEARRATVSIETPWGTGSGFFLSDNYIVTNRHVVEMDQEQLVEFKRRVDAGRDLIKLEKQKIRDMRARMKKMPKGPTRSQLKIIISERERELNRVLPEYKEAERRLAEMERKVQPADIKIILADGTSHIAGYVMLSENHDLALLSLYMPDTSYLTRPPENSPIRQGDTVYTIGSPVGLRNTVTAGVFSGYRKQKSDGKVFLQTDAPINPGSSGGPLIDVKGYVRGVNTMILLNTEGIGFAIPIELVFEEFGSSL